MNGKAQFEFRKARLKANDWTADGGHSFHSSFRLRGLQEIQGPGISAA